MQLEFTVLQMTDKPKIMTQMNCTKVFKHILYSSLSVRQFSKRGKSCIYAPVPHKMKLLQKKTVYIKNREMNRGLRELGIWNKSYNP
jgi:hypothetical protein